MNGHDEAGQSREAGQRHREQEVDGDGVQWNRAEDGQRVDPSLDLDVRCVGLKKFANFFLLFFVRTDLDRLYLIFAEIVLEDIVKINFYLK